MALTLPEIALAAHELVDQHDPDWGLRVAELGEELASALWNPEALVAVSTALAERAEELGCTTLVGASPLGERMAAAAVAIANNGLSGGMENTGGSRVGVVEGVIGTGWGVRQAATEVQRRGATSIVAIAVTTAQATVPDLETVLLFD